jgi:hypothetical protein
VTVEYLDLVDDLAFAADVTGLDVDAVLRVTDVNRGDSAPARTAACFGDSGFVGGRGEDRVASRSISSQRPARARSASTAPGAAGPRSAPPPTMGW